MSKVESKGTLKIGSAEDREAIATILFRNGYTVHPVRYRPEGSKTYQYFVKYEMNGTDKGYDISGKEVGYAEG